MRIQNSLLQPMGIGSDAVQMTKHAGARAGRLSFAVRYAPSAAEFVSEKDLLDCGRLLKYYLEKG